MLQNLVDDRLILDASVRRIGNHLGFASALRADRYIDVEYSLQALRPGHGLMALFRRLVLIFMMLGTFTAFGRRHYDTVFAIGMVRHPDKYTMEACQVYSWLRHQGGQFANKIRYSRNFTLSILTELSLL